MKTCKFGYADGDETCLCFMEVEEITESEDIECFWEFLGDCVGCSMYECIPAYTTTHGMIQSSSPEATK